MMRGGRVVADLPVHELLRRFRQDRYQIVVGALTQGGELSLPVGTTVSGGGSIVLTSAVDDHAIYGLPAQLSDRGLPLRSVRLVHPSLDAVLLDLGLHAAPNP